MTGDSGRDALLDRRGSALLGTDHLLVAALTLLGGGSVIALVGQYTAAQAGPAIVLSLLMAALGAVPVLFCLREAMRRTPAAAGLLALLEAACGRPAAVLLGALLLLELLAIVAGVAHSVTRHMYAALEASSIDPGRWLPRQAAAMIGLLLIAAAAALMQPRRALQLACALLTMKVGIGMLVLMLAARHVHYANWIPWLPSATAPYRFGLGGVLAATVPLLGIFASVGLLVGFAGRVQRARAQVTTAGSAAVLVVMLWLMVLVALQSGLVEFAALASTRPLSVALRGLPQLQWLLPLLPTAGWAGLAALQVVLWLLAFDILSTLRTRLLPTGDRSGRAGRVVLIVLAVLLALLLPERWLPALPGPASLLVLAALCLGVLRPRGDGQGVVPRKRGIALALLAPLAAALCLLPAAQRVYALLG